MVLGLCGQNHCSRFEIATALAFIGWLTVSPSFPLNFGPWFLDGTDVSIMIYRLASIECVEAQ
jgi:hypothetical protein